jgi:hypothetical protein
MGAQIKIKDCLIFFLFSGHDRKTCNRLNSLHHRWLVDGLAGWQNKCEAEDIMPPTSGFV